ncbi:helix-turn-helix transcriptional regulator [Gilvibacter sp.]|uniref:helix-turn-helix transcriptional regulator n=1 Tax=Gilvibacter sp. TaxID=2729997 RepID=UPI003B52A967
MATHVISRRLQLLIQYIYDSNFPSKQDIIEWLKEKDFKLSVRTFERDLERIRSDYGLEITYDKSKDGYFINEAESVKVDSFFKFLEIVNLADLFTDSLKDNRKILDIVDFDDSRSFKGIDNLRTLLLAITQGRNVTFEHENYTNETLTDYTITPLLLKEYENRWYVIGVPSSINDIRTFGLDRIKGLELVGSSKINKQQYAKQLSRFNNIVGLHYEDNLPVKIRLLVNQVHIKYMRSLPLHHSQVIHSRNKDGQYFVDFCLVPNYEFKTQILKMGPEAVMLYPESLKTEIKEMLSLTLARY